MTKMIFSFDDKSAKKIKNKKEYSRRKRCKSWGNGKIGAYLYPGFTMITTEVCDIFYKNKKFTLKDY